MIGVVDVKVQADNPQMPLAPFSAFVGSPSSVRVRNVPREIGSWKIEQVFVAVNYPDNRVLSVEAKLVGGVWVATIAASDVAGQSENGFTISANGKDENGQPVVGYVLGRGDVFILDADATIKPGETMRYVHIVDSRPDDPKRGDAYVDGGVWWFYNGAAWVTLGGTFAGNGWAQYPQSQGGDGKWHRVIIASGTLAYDEQGFDEPPDAAPFALKSELTAETERATEAENARVPTDGDHTINGVKTFAQSPLVPTIQSTDENSQKAASTGWVASKIAAWWNAIKSTVTFAKAQVGLGNVDNTSDVNKPISAETQAALNLKANANAVVKLSGNQTIGGDKTFSGTITSTGSSVKGEAFAAASFPSSSYVSTTFDLSSGAYQTYTAEFNGYVCVRMLSHVAGAHLSLSVGNLYVRNYCMNSNSVIAAIIPVKKGSIVGLMFYGCEPYGSTVNAICKANAEV